MEIFKIEYDSPLGVYVPGQQVRGSIHIQTKENIKANAILLYVKGIAHTSWYCETHNREQSEAYIRGRETYFDSKIVVWDNRHPENKMLLAGTHLFPFAFNLPYICPPSFENRLGYIRYYCQAKIERAGFLKFDKTIIRPFTIIPHFDLNTVSNIDAAIQIEGSKYIGVLMFKHGRIHIKVTLPKSGYVPGETISAKFEIDDISSKEIERINLVLVELTIYEGMCERNDHIDTAYDTRVVKKTSQAINCPANKSAEYMASLQIPPVVPSFNCCPVIKVSYNLEVIAVAKGLVNNELCVKFPILIGTIPVFQQNVVPLPSAPAFWTPPQPCAPPNEINGPPPSYMESMFGNGALKLVDEEHESHIGFNPIYIYYKNFGHLNESNAAGSSMRASTQHDEKQAIEEILHF